MRESRRDGKDEFDGYLSDLQGIVDDFLKQRNLPRVLEAGCGSAGYLSWAADVDLLGVDISSKQLMRNTTVDMKVVGDLHELPLADGSVDLVVCWDVLEHLPDPNQALMHFRRILRQGGMIVLALPNVRSMKGVITKFTPYFFHLWVYRYLLRSKVAGTEDHGPFRTYLRWCIAPNALQEFFRMERCGTAYMAYYESAMQRKLRERCGITGWRWRTLEAGVRWASLRTIDPGKSDCILVIRDRRSST